MRRTLRTRSREPLTVSLKPSVWVGLTWCARLVVASLFLYAGATKLQDPAAFAQEIDHYELLPWLAPYLAVTLPTIELVLGLGLAVGPAPWFRAAALACAGLMAVFTFAAGSALYRDLNIDCGCFGSGSGPITWLTIVRDVALLSAALFAAWAPSVRPNQQKRKG